MLRIWGRTNSINVQKVMWTVGELGLAHQRIDAGGKFGGLDSAEYGAMNPNRRVPTIDDGGVILWESNACVRYFAARYGAGSLWAEDPAERAFADRWMDWQVASLLPDLGVAFWGLIRTPAAERDPAAIAAAAGRLGGLFGILDDALAGRDFITGSQFTMGDIPIGAACYRYQERPIERPRLPHLEAWYERLKRRAPFREHVMIPLS
jgi:glutathione S-transferase